MASLDVIVKRVDRVYHPGEIVSGFVVINSNKKLSHNGIKLTMDGIVELQLSARSVGMWEAFNNALKPIPLVHLVAQVSPPGKLPAGRTEFPFEFKLEPLVGQERLFETYHGVFVNIQYNLRCECIRGMLAKNLTKSLEFIVEIGSDAEAKVTKLPFTVTPEHLQNVKKNALKNIPEFKITGALHSSVCEIMKPFTGEIIVEDSKAIIKSIELQLVRVETCGCADGFAKEATEIQNIQVADGDVVRNLSIPLYMIFPRLFTCPTVAAKTFKVEFEVNLVVLLADGHLITENFPIRLIRENQK